MLLAMVVCAFSSLQAAERPNIILFYTDDHGYADLGIHGVLKDIRTPHIDALAHSGVLARHGYSSAPQCVPSRGGLLVGKFQGRFNLDSNRSDLAGFNRETTIATRLQKAGYVTAQFGKWHLGPPEEITKHGFKHVFSQHVQKPFSANITPTGQDIPLTQLSAEMYHIDACSHAAAAVIERYKAEPFFLYVAYRAPHTPMDAPQKYTDRFPGEMPERRRQALAMISAVDDGVGLITRTLKEYALTEKTLVFFIGDNGAPLKIHKVDSPLNEDAGGWDGSLNTPLNGEKGMLSEGGMHVPFVIAWPGTVPGGQVYEHPISALDVAATAAAQAHLVTQPGDLDGVNLLPYLKGEVNEPPHDALMWRWMAQSAIRQGNWKLLRGGEREYLYDLSTDLEEKKNVADTYPEVATRLRGQLKTWSDKLNPPGLALGPMAQIWHDYFDHYLEGKMVALGQGGESQAVVGIQGWQARNGSLSVKDSALVMTADAKSDKGARPFLTNADIRSLAGPVTVTLKMRSQKGGQGSFSWRTQAQKDFLKENTVSFSHEDGDHLQEVQVELPVVGQLIHVRLLPGPGAGKVEIISLEMRAADGQVQVWEFKS